MWKNTVHMKRKARKKKGKEGEREGSRKEASKEWKKRALAFSRMLKAGW